VQLSNQSRQLQVSTPRSPVLLLLLAAACGARTDLAPGERDAGTDAIAPICQPRATKECNKLAVVVPSTTIDARYGNPTLVRRGQALELIFRELNMQGSASALAVSNHQFVVGPADPMIDLFSCLLSGTQHRIVALCDTDSAKPSFGDRKLHFFDEGHHEVATTKTIPGIDRHLVTDDQNAYIAVDAVSDGLVFARFDENGTRTDLPFPYPDYQGFVGNRSSPVIATRACGGLLRGLLGNKPNWQPELELSYDNPSGAKLVTYGRPMQNLTSDLRTLVEWPYRTNSVLYLWGSQPQRVLQRELLDDTGADAIIDSEPQPDIQIRYSTLATTWGLVIVPAISSIGTEEGPGTLVVLGRDGTRTASLVLDADAAGEMTYAVVDDEIVVIYSDRKSRTTHAEIIGCAVER